MKHLLIVAMLLLPNLKDCKIPTPPTPSPSPTVTPEPTPTPTPTPSPTPSAGLIIDFTRFELVNGGPALMCPDPEHPGQRTGCFDKIIKDTQVVIDPNHCDGGRCLLPGFTQQTYNEAFCVQFRIFGKACGHTGTDEVTVGNKAEDGALVQNIHPFVQGTPPTALFPPQSRTPPKGDSWTLRAIGGPPTPPTPTPGPVVTPTPPPGPETCETAVLPPLADLGPSLGMPQGPRSSFYRVDLHPHVEDAAFCAAHGMGLLPDGVSVRRNCPPRQEGHPLRICLDRKLVNLPTDPEAAGCWAETAPAACFLKWENLSGGPADWQPEDPQKHPNPFQHDFPVGQRFRVCSLTTPPVCAEGGLP